MSRGELLNLAGDLWALVFAASLVASLVAGGVQAARHKPLWESPAMPALFILHLAWALPFILPVLAVYAGVAAVRWLLKLGANFSV